MRNYLYILSTLGLLLLHSNTSTAEPLAPTYTVLQQALAMDHLAPSKVARKMASRVRGLDPSAVAAQFPGYSDIAAAAQLAGESGYFKSGAISAIRQGDIIRVHSQVGKMRARTEFSLTGKVIRFAGMSITGTGSRGRTYAMNIKAELPRIRLRIIDRARKTREFPLVTAAPHGGLFHQLEQALQVKRGTPRQVAKQLALVSGQLQGEALAETLPGFGKLKVIAAKLAQKRVTGAYLKSGRASGVALGTFGSLTKGPVQSVSARFRQGKLTMSGIFSVERGEVKLQVATVAGRDKSGREISLEVRPQQRAQLISKGLNNQWRAHAIQPGASSVRIKAPAQPSGWR